MSEPNSNLRLKGFVPTAEAAYLIDSSERSLRRRANAGGIPTVKDDSNRLWFKVWNNQTEQANEDEISRKTVARRAGNGEYKITQYRGRTFYSRLVVNPL